MGMAYTTPTAMLQLIRNAMVSILEDGVKELTIQDKTYTNQDLDKLQKLETFWAARAARESTGDVSYGRFGRAL